jgi:hypothetical protein
MGSGFGSFAFAGTFASHSLVLTSEVSSTYRFFTFSMYPMFEHLGIVILLLPQFLRIIIT